MKFSRFLGAAITGGVLLSGGLVQAQINYRVPTTPPSQNTAAPVSHPYGFQSQPFRYPTTSVPQYSVASVPSMPTQFSGPTNAPMTRLPPSDTPSLAANSPVVGNSGISATNSVLTSPVIGSGPIAGPLNGPTNGPLNNANVGPITGPISGRNWSGTNMPSYGSGATATRMPSYSGIGYGTGAGTEKGLAPIENNMGKTPGSGAAFQPFCASDCGTGCYVGPNCWYGGVYGMVLARDKQEHYTFSYDNSNESVQYTDAKDADMGWGGGFAAVAGRSFNCGQNAVEAVYWGWFPEEASTSTFGANTATGISGIFNWDSLTYNGLNMGGAFVDNAAVHSLFRESEAHNVELNVLSFSGGLGSNQSCLQYTLLAGVRYFRFRDHLTFRSDPNDVDFTGEVDEVFYDISTTNNLIGLQIGGVGTYAVGPRLSLNGGSKLGLFGNHISHSSQIGGVAGTAVINNGPNAGLEFAINNSKDDVAFLGELFFGAGYAITDRWSASAGYRAVAVTGLASPTDQIYPDVRGINDLYTIESQSSLILHGAYFGAQFNF